MNRFVTVFAAAALLLSLAAADARAQTWQMLASFPGRPASAFVFAAGSVRFSVKDRLDFDGDGVAEIAMIAVVDPTNPNVVYLKIHSGADPNQQWQIPLPNGIIAILIGFLDFDGNNAKDILLAHKVGRQFVNPMVLYNIDVNSGTYEVGIPDGSTVLIGGWDLDNDGYYELVVGSPDKKEVQIWGFK